MTWTADWERVARELVRAVRGRRSQTALSRRLGYRTNAVYAWEAGRDFPRATTFFKALEKTGVDLGEALTTFYRGNVPAPVARTPLTRPEGVAALLSDLRGGVTLLSLAEQTGFSRYAIARWLSGQTQPRLPFLLALVEASTLRGLDFLAALTDPAQLPSVAAAHADLVATRRAAHAAPWTQAVLRCLELSDYRALPAHQPGWIAARIGISLDEEAACLKLLHDSGQLAWTDGRYQVARVLSLDTRRDPASTLALRRFWTEQALRRLDAGVESGAESLFSYNVFGVSEADLHKLQALHAEYYQQMRELIARSEPVERVVVASTQIVPLDRPK